MYNRVKSAPPDSYIKVGSLLAKQGAWQRKYVVTRIHFGDDHAVVCIKQLGNFWADGRSQPASKVNEREVYVHTYGKPELKHVSYYTHVVEV
jgi:hypothetical protein